MKGGMRTALQSVPTTELLGLYGLLAPYAVKWGLQGTDGTSTGATCYQTPHCSL